MKTVLGAYLLALSAFILGSVVHEWAWPHSSVYVATDSEMKNVAIEKWGGAAIVVRPGAGKGAVMDHLTIRTYADHPAVLFKTAD